MQARRTLAPLSLTVEAVSCRALMLRTPRVTCRYALFCVCCTCTHGSMRSCCLHVPLRNIALSFPQASLPLDPALAAAALAAARLGCMPDLLTVAAMLSADSIFASGRCALAPGSELLWPSCMPILMGDHCVAVHVRCLCTVHTGLSTICVLGRGSVCGCILEGFLY
jgi:Helicase associated domain (HA2)